MKTQWNEFKNLQYKKRNPNSMLGTFKFIASEVKSKKQQRQELVAMQQNLFYISLLNLNVVRFCRLYFLIWTRYF